MPAVNAALNSLAGVLLVLGYAQIRRGQRIAHKRTMLTAFATSIAFLACYLLYHFALRHYTGSSSRAFPGTGVVRTAYLSILLTHVVLAAAVPVLALVTIRRGYLAERQQDTETAAKLWQKHRRIAKVTLPVWLYVSVTGVIIYVMLYHWTAG